jgi:lysophospholipase L1-like esterase
MQKNMLIVYVVSLHLVLALVLFKTDFIARVGHRLGLVKNLDPEISPFHKSMVAIHMRQVPFVHKGTIMFFGDSCIQGLCVSAAANPSVNFGIGGDTTLGLLERLPSYLCLDRAGACVVEIGGNDLKIRKNEEILSNYSRIIQAFPPKVPLVIIAVLPVDERARDDLPGRNERTEALNGGLKRLCSERGTDCLFLDPAVEFADGSGNLKKEFHEGDGIHLSREGYAVLIEKLRTAVRSILSTRENSGRPGSGAL